MNPTFPAQGGHGGAGATIFGGGCICISSVIWLALMVFWIWMIVDVATKNFPGDNEQIVWLLVTILLGPLGAAIYFFVGRPKGVKRS